MVRSTAYAEFFEALTGSGPFPYQTQLAQQPWPALLDIPTGLGKTAAVIVSWIYKRLQYDPATGSRLVYCLPMRVLVAQTRDSAMRWCERAAPWFEEAKLSVPSVHVLMGGDVDAAWEHEPEQPAVLIGTQDMLLSRALNRGYAMSRYKWPVHFGLLNNDCTWVFDETQLVGVGIETSAQLQAFRNAMGALGPTHTLWMSATLGSNQLATVDHPEPKGGWPRHGLTSDDLEHQVVQRRTRAAKPITKLDGLQLDAQSQKEAYILELAHKVRTQHEQRGGLTLVIVNRVPRAQALFEALHAEAGPDGSHTATGLVHARFRSADRSAHEALLAGERDRIVVATQAVEAGVDVSARTLVTELAPWPSLVQRFGRCNRYGAEDAAIFWIDIDTAEERLDAALPYERAELDRARHLLKHLEDLGADAGPERLREVAYEAPSVVRPVLRRRDLLDLFDSTPDLCGNDLDVSRYVRDGEDTDVQFYWRAFDGEPTAEMPRPRRDELCRASVTAARDFIRRLHKKRGGLGGSHKDLTRRAQLTAWSWSPLGRDWSPADRVFAGRVILLHTEAGGYDPDLGWTGDVAPKSPVPEVEGSGGDIVAEDAMDADRDTHIGRWVHLGAHLGHVRDQATELAVALGLAQPFGQVLATAGLWHDVGKAHPAFQRKLLDPVEEKPQLQPQGMGPWAKSNHRLKANGDRRHFRHELASALAWLQAGDAKDEQTRSLVAYLVAAHHGKVRLSLRSVPGETRPEDPGRLFARGVWDRDVLQAFDLPDGRRLEGIALDLSLMQLGEASWLERMLHLRDARELGPFRLALLETVVRIADWRASGKEQRGDYDDT